jgi:DNA replication protein DnaC
MRDNQIVDRLTRLRLPGMKDEYLRQEDLSEAMESLSFGERFDMLTEAEMNRRMASKLTKSLRDAKLRDVTASLETVDYRASRGIKKEDIARLSGCSFIRENRHLIITGPTGTGKTFLASAFGNAACRQGFTVRCFRAHRLLIELNVSANDGTLEKHLANLKKPDLLILDDFGAESISPSICRNLLEVIEDRNYGQSKSILFTAQMPIREWHSLMEDKTAADAIMDRIVNSSYRIELQGASLRRPDNSILVPGE